MPCIPAATRLFTQIPFAFLLLTAASPAGTALAQATRPNGVAVLNDGRVFQGSIQEVPGGYRVQHAGGSSILPFDQISITSATLVGAYEAYRDSFRTPSADNHLRLAEWCLTNGLYAQADIEVQAALRLEPMRSDARALLQQVDAILRPRDAKMIPAAQPTQPPARAAISVGAFAGSQTQKGSAGLGREAQLDFMRKVQPLLINSCGNAHCHGPNVENQFRLRNARFDSPNLRSASENNLQVLFQFIDYERPEQSPLLTRPASGEGPHQKLFTGPRNQSQFEILDNWVQRVAAERQSGTSVASVKPLAPQSSKLIRPGESIQLVSAEVAVSPASEPATPNPLPENLKTSPVPVRGNLKPASPVQPTTASPAENQPEFLDQLRKSQLPDSFDPEVFNREMHSKPR